MKRMKLAFWMGSAWLLIIYSLWAVKFFRDPDLLNSWQASDSLWPGNTIAILAGGGGMLGLFQANFEVAALSNLIFNTIVAYVLLSLVALATRVRRISRTAK
jgi:hypothetical protein